jgi:hypothetical protein
VDFLENSVRRRSLSEGALNVFNKGSFFFQQFFTAVNAKPLKRFHFPVDF